MQTTAPSEPAANAPLLDLVELVRQWRHARGSRRRGLVLTLEDAVDRYDASLEGTA